MYAKYFKRGIDFILSLCALIGLSPVLLILMILGTVFMGGNPFFTHNRPGKDEKIFKLINDCYKKYLVCDPDHIYHLVIDR